MVHSPSNLGSSMTALLVGLALLCGSATAADHAMTTNLNVAATRDAAAAVAAASPKCAPGHIEHGQCLASSLPILRELGNITEPSQCCAACAALSGCVSWTLNSRQHLCHLRATFKGYNRDAMCVSGQMRPPPPPPPPPRPAPVNARNVLVILVDDLRPQLGCYNVSVCGARMITPNIDSLAARGIVFSHAYCQYAVCAPSRNSFMSGRRPDTTLAYNFKNSFREAPGGTNWTAFPESFKKFSYNVTGCGKTYHSGLPPNFDEPYSWTQGVPYVGYNQGLGFCGDHCACTIDPYDPQKTTDVHLANRTLEILASHAVHGIKPWAHFVGFIRPHVDWSAPQEFWDLYPEHLVEPAKHELPPRNSPPVAWVDGGYVDRKAGDVGPNYKFSPFHPVNDTVSRFWRRGYYAAVSYVDSQIGRVLNALEESGMANETVVALLADHGYQLGEHSMWEKYTVWELATHVPMIVSDPAQPDTHGRTSTALVESVDLYPTLVELSGIPQLPPTEGLEGHSFAPLLSNPDRPWKRASFSQYARCAENKTSGYFTRCSGLPRDQIQAMGYTVRTQDFRYTEWYYYNASAPVAGPGPASAVFARELYNHTIEVYDFDDEVVNIYGTPGTEEISSEHSEILRQGWKHALPPQELK